MKVQELAALMYDETRDRNTEPPWRGASTKVRERCEEMAAVALKTLGEEVSWT